MCSPARDNWEEFFAKFSNMPTANDMNCFGCSQALGTKPKQLQSGQWVADCDACGITNKLVQDTDNPDRFSVSGALVSILRDGKN